MAHRNSVGLERAIAKFGSGYLFLFKFFFFKVFVEILGHGVAHWDGQTSFILFLLEFQES